jgi:hypothetical protein
VISFFLKKIWGEGILSLQSSEYLAAVLVTSMNKFIGLNVFMRTDMDLTFHADGLLLTNILFSSMVITI